MLTLSGAMVKSSFLTQIRTYKMFLICVRAMKAIACAKGFGASLVFFIMARAYRYD